MSSQLKHAPFVVTKRLVVFALALTISFSGYSMAGEPDIVELTGHMGQFDRTTYLIGKHSSLLTEAQSGSGIRKLTYHDASIALQVSENDATSADQGVHLKDLVTVEWLLTSNPGSAYSQAQVPGGWPVDLTFRSGRVAAATIHSAPFTKHFVALRYRDVRGRSIVTSWSFDRRTYAFDAARIVSTNIERPTITNRWSWKGSNGSWSVSLTRFGGRPSIPISVNGVSTRCVLDTGAAGLVISAQDASRFKVASIGKAYGAPTVGAIREESYGRARFDVGPADLPGAVVFISSSIPADLALCGYDFLSSFNVLIGGASVTVSAHPTGRSCEVGCVDLDTWDRQAIGKIRFPPVLIPTANFDTGLDSSLILSAYMVPPGGTGGPGCDDLPNLTVAKINLGTVHVCYATLRDPSIEAIVGSGILLKQDLLLDLGNRRMWIVSRH